MKIWMLSSLLWIAVTAQATDTGPNGQFDSTSSASTNQEKALILKNVKPRPDPAEDRESSSYMGDPDPLDPLKVKNESIKDDEEPVLNEIRDVANVPGDSGTTASPDSASTSQPATSPAEGMPADMAPQAAVDEKPAVEKKATEKPKPVKKKKAMAKKKAKKVAKTKKIKTKKVRAPKKLKDDDADLSLERRFYRVYKKYNSKPTSDTAWAKVIGKRQSHVYTVQPGDTLWSISGILFGDKFFWPKLWAVNREGIENPHQIDPGLKVYFRAGQENSAPGLEIEGQESSYDVLTDADDADHIKSSDDNVIVASNSDQDVKLGRRRHSKEPTPLPDSIPPWVNKKYFQETVRPIKMDLGENINNTPTYKSNVILSSARLNSDFSIPFEQISRGGRCDSGAIYKNIQAEEDNQHPIGEYVILQPLEKIETSAEEKVFPYEVMGSGEVVQNQFNVHDCHALMETDFVFIRKDSLDSIRKQPIVGENSSEIIGGSDLGDQKLFAVDQLVYLSLGHVNASAGETVQLRSQINDKINGKVKILDRFGNYAVGVLTEVNDVIEKGDAIVF